MVRRRHSDREWEEYVREARRLLEEHDEESLTREARRFVRQDTMLTWVTSLVLVTPMATAFVLWPNATEQQRDILTGSGLLTLLLVMVMFLLRTSRVRKATAIVLAYRLQEVQRSKKPDASAGPNGRAET